MYFMLFNLVAIVFNQADWWSTVENLCLNQELL